MSAGECQTTNRGDYDDVSGRQQTASNGCLLGKAIVMQVINLFLRT